MDTQHAGKNMDQHFTGSTLLRMAAARARCHHEATHKRVNADVIRTSINIGWIYCAQPLLVSPSYGKSLTPPGPQNETNAVPIINGEHSSATPAITVIDGRAILICADIMVRISPCRLSCNIQRQITQTPSKPQWFA